MPIPGPVGVGYMEEVGRLCWGFIVVGVTGTKSGLDPSEGKQAYRQGLGAEEGRVLRVSILGRSLAGMFASRARFCRPLKAAAASGTGSVSVMVVRS